MVGWHHWLSGHESEQTLGDNEGQGSLACCGPWRCKESDTTCRLNNNNSRKARKHTALSSPLSFLPLAYPTSTSTRPKYWGLTSRCYCPKKLYLVPTGVKIAIMTFVKEHFANPFQKKGFLHPVSTFYLKGKWKLVSVKFFWWRCPLLPVSIDSPSDIFELSLFTAQQKSNLLQPWLFHHSKESHISEIKLSYLKCTGDLPCKEWEQEY